MTVLYIDYSDPFKVIFIDDLELKVCVHGYMYVFVCELYYYWV